MFKNWLGVVKEILNPQLALSKERRRTRKGAAGTFKNHSGIRLTPGILSE
jgi:hypothetical protein